MDHAKVSGISAKHEYSELAGRTVARSPDGLNVAIVEIGGCVSYNAHCRLFVVRRPYETVRSYV